MTPVPANQRYAHIDLLRGIALFGVLLMNVFSGFSTSLFGYITRPQPTVLAELVEFRALSLFAFLFGLGAAIQAERVPGPHAFLARRFAVLLAIGLAHIVFVWNGDILAQYAVAGLLLIPFIRARAVLVLAGAAVAFVLPRFASMPVSLPSEAEMRVHAVQAAKIYAHGSYFDVLAFRWSEALHWVMPLWIQSLPFTLGLMLLGVAAWKHDALRHPQDHRRTLWLVLMIGLAAALLDYSLDLDVPWTLSVAYGAAILLWVSPERLAPVAALGRMALTNYLLQSVVLTLVFNGYGLGAFDKLSPTALVLLSAALYVAQAYWSRAWLRGHNFGPVEWLWRAATYGKFPTLRA